MNRVRPSARSFLSASVLLLFLLSIGGCPLDQRARSDEEEDSGKEQQLVAQGKRAAHKCEACHDFTPQRRNQFGPYLWGIFGQPAGQVPGYVFSQPHMAAAASLVWDEKTLDTYLKNPKDFIPGNRMAFAGLKRFEERKALIAYLKTLQSP